MVLDEGIRVATRLLEKNGEFYPFAIVRHAEGELRHLEAGTNDEFPVSDRVIQLLQSGLRDGASTGKYKTTSIVSDVSMRDRVTGITTDAIRVDIDDCEEDPVTCYLPYTIKNTGIEWGNIVAEQGTLVIFQ